jgi:hypothetical protein
MIQYFSLATNQYKPNFSRKGNPSDELPLLTKTISYGQLHLQGHTTYPTGRAARVQTRNSALHEFVNGVVRSDTLRKQLSYS